MTAGTEINEGLVSVVGKPKERKKGKDAKTVTDIYATAHFERAVFSLAFDTATWALKPSQANDWGLRENPCWPQAIAPDDPGYVLLKNDKWYKTAGPKGNDVVDDYTKHPEKAELDRALAWLEKKPNYNKALLAQLKNSNGQGTGTGTGKGNGKGKGKGTGTGQKQQPRSNDDDDNDDSNEWYDVDYGGWDEMIDRLPVLDSSSIIVPGANSTRRLTPREIEEEYEIIPCEDPTCSKERDARGGGGLVIPRGAVAGRDAAAAEEFFEDENINKPRDNLHVIATHTLSDPWTAAEAEPTPVNKVERRTFVTVGAPAVTGRE